MTLKLGGDVRGI